MNDQSDKGDNNMLEAVNEEIIRIGSFELRVATLNTGERVIYKEDFDKFLEKIKENMF